jgi:Zn-dependent peptidase ImmA (M78 family)
VAQEDRASSGVARERRLAATLVRRLELAPPVDIRGVADRFAIVEEDAIPGTCDGLAIGLTHARPRIIVKPTGNSRRQRFTLAHELGHVLLPWHTGSNLACLARPGELGGYRASQAETEANRFAAELLVPQSWLNDLVSEHGVEELSSLMQAIEQAEVSAHVASLKLAGVLPPGFGFALVDAAKTVELVGQSPGMNLPLPDRGERLQSASLDRLAVHREIVEYAGRRVIWWSFHEAEVRDRAEDARSAKEDLTEVVSRHSRDEQERKSIYGRISSVIGAANSQAEHDGRTGAAELHARFRSRFAVKRDLPDGLPIDPDFLRWLERRAAELGR